MRSSWISDLRAARFPYRSLALACLLYLALALPQLHLPGLYYDEALDAVPALEVLHGEDADSALATLPLAGRQWPLMVLSYVGPTSTYLLLPFFALMGIGEIPLRIMTVLLGLITLPLLYLFVRELADRDVASWSTLLLATHLSFVAWSRTGIYVSFPLIPLALGSAWLVLRWSPSPDRAAAASTGFLWGLGLTTKILFVWVITAQVAGIIWAKGRTLPRPTLGSIAAGLAGGIVGGLPLLFYNLSGFGTLETIRRNLTTTELYGVSNLDLLQNLLTRLENLWALSSASWASAHGGTVGNPLAGVVLVISPVLALRAGLTRESAGRYLLGTWTVTFLLSLATISSFGPAHLLVLLPFLVAIAAWVIVRWAPRPHWLLAGLVASNLLSTAQYHLGLHQTGGRAWFSDAIYAAAEHLKQEPPGRTIALDWGIAKNIRLLTVDRIRPIEVFTYGEPGEAFRDWFLFLQDDPEVRYLMHPEPLEAFRGHRGEFQWLAREHFRQIVVDRVFRTRTGDPVLELVRLEMTSPSGSVPPDAQTVGVELGGRLRLEAFSAEIPPARDSLHVTLYWRTIQDVEGAYTAFLHLLDSESRLVAQVDRPPTAGTYPTEVWQKDDFVADFYRLSLPTDLESGVYRLYAGMYQTDTVERLPMVRNAQRLEGDVVELITLELPP